MIRSKSLTSRNLTQSFFVSASKISRWKHNVCIGGVVFVMCCLLYMRVDMKPDERKLISDVRREPVHKRNDSSSYKTRTRHSHRICPLFTCDECGLGNKIFQYASAYGLALHLNMTLVVTTPYKLGKLFQISKQGNIEFHNNRITCKNMKLVKEKYGCCKYDKQFKHLNTNRDYMIGDYLFSWKYFSGFDNEIRNLLTFNHKLKTISKTFIFNALRRHSNRTTSNTAVVGIHVRRGDMTRASKQRRGYNVATTEYFEKAIELFSEKINKSIIFITATNDAAWTKKNILLNPKLQKYNFELLHNNSAEVDFAILANCDHMISSVGTFGWWASWLSGGMVSYFKWPVKSNTYVGLQYSQNFTDYFLPNWIGIE